MIGTARDLATDAPVPDGLSLRTVSSRADLDRVAAMESEVWGEDWSWLADDLVERIADPHAPATVYVVEDGDRVVSAAWLAPDRGHPVRRALGRKHPGRLPGPRHLPSAGRPACRRRGGRRLLLAPGRRLGRQPADPGAAGLARGRWHDAVHLDATTHGVTRHRPRRRAGDLRGRHRRGCGTRRPVGHRRPQVGGPLRPRQVAPGQPTRGGHQTLRVEPPDRNSRADVDRQRLPVRTEEPLQPGRLGGDRVPEPNPGLHVVDLDGLVERRHGQR